MMSALKQQTIEMIDMLPDTDIAVINELLKKLIRAWDPDFTRATPQEKTKMDAAVAEMENGIYFSDEEVWN